MPHDLTEWEAVKDPEERKDYGLDWSAEMVASGDDTISSSTWSIVTVGNSLVIDDNSFDVLTHIVKIWFTGGDVGTVRLLNHLETEGGRTFEHSVKLKIQSK